MDNGIRTLNNSSQNISIDENFKLIAGPGSGKTTFLVNHIKNVIKNSDKLKNGRKILCITYTNVAVDTIKERLGNHDNEVEISTIHHFLYKHILKPYIWVLKTEINSNLLDLSSVNISFPSFSVLPDSETKKLLAMGKNLKNIFSQLQKFYWILDDDEIKPKCPGLIPFQTEYLLKYKDNLWSDGRITPDDILKFSYEILIKEPMILNVLRIKFPHIFVDEFQDVCNVQCKIIELICEKDINIGVIGDPAQSIYSFRGANYGNLENLNLNMQNYIIKNNFRSSDKIVNILNNFRRDNLIQIAKINGDTIPKILIGDKLKAYSYVLDVLDSDLTVLSYEHKELNDLNFMLSSKNYSTNRECLNEFWKLDDYPRKTIIEYIIRAIESFREGDFQNSMRYMIFASHYYESDENKIMKKLFDVSQNYENFKSKTIKEFYLENIYIEEVDCLKNLNRGKRKTIYESLNYMDLVNDIKNSHNNNFRTIHSCKGAEFDNVLILTNDSYLKFLFDFDMGVELHRLYYVAMSRARNNLFISISSLNDSRISILKDKGFEIINLNDII